MSIMMASMLSFAVTFLTILCLIKVKYFWVLDCPESRSLHTEPISRIGGVGIIAGIFSAWGSWSTLLPAVFFICFGLLVLVSLADDIWKLPVWIRLLIHCIAAVSVSQYFFSDSSNWLVILSTSVMIIWMSNLYNFMDGSDGLAGGMTLIGFGYYGLYATLAGNHEFALINFSISMAALAFLFYNFNPARIFMGDVGAVPLGFMAAALAILGWINQIWSVWFPLFIFSPFIMDATITIAKRGVRGENIWQAHCQHYYQRLIASGLGHRHTALLYYVLMLTVGASAIWAEFQSDFTKGIISIIWGCIYFTLMFYTERHLKQASWRQNVCK